MQGKETWAYIPGYEGVYECSTHGRVRSVDREIPMLHSRKKTPYIMKRKGKIRKQQIDHEGYYCITLKQRGKVKRAKVSRLVALTHIPNPEGLPQVNHIDGDKSNNHVGNLEWCTCEHNNRHKVKLPTYESVKGERHGSAKLTKEQVLEIRQRAATTRNKDLAEAYGVSDAAIHLIISRKNWSHI